MTTSRDLMITAMDAGADRPVSQGELSLALAGAELIDLLAADAVTLDGDRIVPAGPAASGDPLLEQAAAAVVTATPYETVEDWLWRRGRDLAGTYAAAFASEGLLARRRGRMPLPTGPVVVAESEDHSRARDRWAAREPVLASLGTSAGLDDTDAKTDAETETDIQTGTDAGQSSHAPVDGPVGGVLAAVADAVTELAAVRQQRDIEQAAFDNIWRAP